MARSGNSRRRTIALLADYMTQFVGSYEAQFRSAFDSKCRALDLNLLLVYGASVDLPNAASVAQNAIFDLMHPDCVDGLVLLSSSLASYCGTERIRRFAERYRPLPLCSIGLALPGVPSVVVENQRGMEAVVEHLVRDHGHRRVAYISGPPDNPEAQMRFLAYRRVLERYDIPLDPAIIADGYFVSPKGYAAMEKILERGGKIDAVVAANDNMAIAAIQALRKHGYCVPRDLAVTGFDNLMVASLGNPPLSTVAQPFESITAQAIHLLQEQFDGHRVPDCTELPAEFVVRRSCGCNRRAHKQKPRNLVTPNVNASEFLREDAAGIKREVAVCMRTGASDGWSDATRLLDALQAEVDGHKGTFCQAVEEMLEETGSDQEHCRALQNATTYLREQLRAFGTLNLEDLWHDARDLIGLSSIRGQIQHRIELDDSYAQMLEAGEQVARALDEQSLKEGVLKILPGMRIDTACISRYPDDFSAELEPLVCMIDGRSQDPLPGRFPAQTLLPPGAYTERRHTSMVFPLVGKTQQVGVAVFEYSEQSFGQQMLRDQISAALGSIRLHQEVLEKTMQNERSLHERLAAAKRMQSLSVLAGGVAHDLNNSLGPLVALPDVILRDLEGTGIERMAPELRMDVESIKSASLRAAQTIKDLLTLGRQGRMTKELIDLGQTVANCLTANNLRFLKEANNRVKIVVDVPKQPLIVRASEAHLARAITNLVRNAVEAIPGEGEVTVKVVGMHMVEPTSGYETVEPGDYAVVTAKDNGRGIPSQDISRVFEPFFSKKRLSDHSGSGLGLSVVHGVVKEHEGFVDVTSIEGEGTTFTLYFPCAKENARLAEPNTPVPLGHAKVLIVDDEAIQRRTASRVLSHLGYQVDTVESGEKAFEMFKQAAASGQSPYDLVILDMNLYEDRDGLAYCQEIQKLFPSQKAIVTSGHAPTERAELAVQKGLAWLAKPYTTETLANAVQAALSARSRQPR